MTSSSRISMGRYTTAWISSSSYSPPPSLPLMIKRTLKSELSSFVDKKQQEKRMDLSVQLKKSKKRTQILFLLEHKSYQSPDVLHQMLEYQTGIYCHQHGTTPSSPLLSTTEKKRSGEGL